MADTVPSGKLGASGDEHPLADRHDQSGLLGQVDELTGRDQAELGMAPTDQCLETDQATGSDLELGLIKEAELVVGDSLAQAPLEGLARACFCRISPV